jgi:hypothetical protein
MRTGVKPTLNSKYLQIELIKKIMDTKLVVKTL